MRIDQTHRKWAVAAITFLTLAVIAYFPYALFYPGGPSGNTVPGLVYGILGYGMMLFAGLLGARKKRPLWRVGRAKVWMRGHLWLGILSLPMILFHGAFQARGPLTIVMLTLLIIVVLSGITGAALQHYMPRRIMAAVELETIYEQIPVVREQLREEAAAIVNKLCAAPSTVAVAAGLDEEEEEAALSEEERANLQRVYSDGILPFLRDPDSAASLLASSKKAKAFFEALRRQNPAAVHEQIGDLESICAEERQLSRQRRMYLLLHGWLLVHVPLSITLLVLGGIHAIVALHY
ncbi:MAG: hypothetical protein KGN84_10070 [Acidobacteriota bacterium]|nr:hypothetical protein [Acidobacteriota bacterium]